MTANGHTAKEPFPQKAEKNKPAQLVTPTPVIIDDVDRTEVPGGFVITNKTTGAIHFETEAGERKEVRAANPAPTMPEKPKPVGGKLVVGNDGVSRFVPDDDTHETIDLTKAIEARDAEAKLTPSEKAIREVEKQFARERERIQSLMTDKEKIKDLEDQNLRLQSELQTSMNVRGRLEQTILGQSLLLAAHQR